MKAAIVNPFVTAAFSVLEMVLGNRPSKRELIAQRTIIASQQCNVIFGITGQIQGQVIYGMSVETADRIASTMIGTAITEFDQLAASAIGELGNMVSGNAMQHLHAAGWTCDITPPTIIYGTDVRVNTISIPAVVIPFGLSQGEVTVTIGLQESK